MNKQLIAETVAKSALNLIPYVGGAISSILSDYLSARKEARLDEFIENYFNDLNQKQEYLIKEYINSGDFLDIFENILSDVMNTRTAIKRNMLKNLLVNSCTIPNTTYERTEDFQHLVDVLSPISLLILSVFYRLRGIYMDGEETSLRKYWEEIREATNIDDEGALLDYIGELESRCLIEGFRNNTYSADSGAPLIGERPFITEKGLLFYKYITEQTVDQLDQITRSDHTPGAQIRREEFDKYFGERTATKETVLSMVGRASQIYYGTELHKHPKESSLFIQIERE